MLPALSTLALAAHSSTIRELLRLTERGDVLSLAGGLPAAGAIPEDLIGLAADRALGWRGRFGPVALQYAPTEGLDRLRESLAARLTARCPDAAVRADEVLVTTGSQQGLDLLGRVLLDPGDVVVVESPTYLGALQAWGHPGVLVESVPGDRDGIDVEELERRLVLGLRPTLVYVVANFANPTGSTLALGRRRALAALADRFRFVVVEDDPYGELRFAGRPVPPVRAFGANVVSLGSASKIIAPGLRVGWMVAPEPIATAVVRVKQAADLHTSSLSQAIVAEVLAMPDRLERHVDAVIDQYRARGEGLSVALRHACGDRLSWTMPEGGMFLWAGLTDVVPVGVDADALLRVASEHGVAFVPGAAFHTGSGDGRRHLRLSFTSLSPGELGDAATRLASALDQVCRGDERASGMAFAEHPGGHDEEAERGGERGRAQLDRHQ